MEYSYGIIPVFLGAREPEYLVINQKPVNSGKDYWFFPKGKPDAGESPVETARREMEEEVGISFDGVDESVSFETRYTFERDATPYAKTAIFFIGEVASKSFRLQEAEVSDAEWLPYSAARDRMTYENGKQLLDRVHAYLTTRLSGKK